MGVLVAGGLGCANSVHLTQPVPVDDLVVARFEIDIEGLESHYPGKNKTSGHPEMKLSVRMLDVAGQVVWRDHVRVRSRKKVVLDERWVLGIRTERSVPDASLLPDLTRRAMTALFRKSRPAA